MMIFLVLACLLVLLPLCFANRYLKLMSPFLFKGPGTTWLRVIRIGGSEDCWYQELREKPSALKKPCWGKDQRDEYKV